MAFVIDVVFGKHLARVEIGDGDAPLIDEDQELGASMDVADAEVVDDLAVAQSDFAELVDRVEADTLLA